MSCVYVGDAEKEKTDKDGLPVFKCLEFGQCVLERHSATGNGILPSCNSCSSRLPIGHGRFAEKFKDHLRITGRDGLNVDLRDLLAGGVAFLVCGGPSAKELDLSQLNQRGIFTLAVNNKAGSFWPNAFVCSDPPQKFHNGIWMDPTIMKFIPIPKLQRKRGRLREKVGDEFNFLMANGKPISACDCPNVWGFERRSWLETDDSFFLEPSAAWGNHNEGVRRTGNEKTVCTPLLGLRILYYLGARRIYLVGVDFWMDPKKGLKENYSFAEDRDADAIESNNRQFRIVNGWLCKLRDQGVFDRFGLEVYNVNRMSGLRAFDYMPFDLAVKDALDGFPTEPFDLSGWYRK